MKLFYKSGACSLSPHIVLRESGLDFTLSQVNLQEKSTESGEDFWSINPAGQVPALLLDNDTLLTEGAVIVQYIADQVPDRQLLHRSERCRATRRFPGLTSLRRNYTKVSLRCFRPRHPKHINLPV